MVYTPSAERQKSDHFAFGEEVALLDDGLSAIYERVAETLHQDIVPSPHLSAKRAPGEMTVEASGSFEMMIDDTIVRYQYQPVEPVIPPRVKKLSIYKTINHNRESFRELVSASIENTHSGVSMELMDALPEEYHVIIPTYTSKENSCFIAWEKVIMLDCNLDSPLSTLYLAHSIGHAVNCQERPDLYTAYTNAMEMALTTITEFNANTINAQRKAWGFALDLLDPFMSDDIGATYNKEAVAEFIEQRSLRWCRETMQDELAHPFKATKKRLGRAALLMLAQSDRIYDLKLTPKEEADIARTLGYDSL